MRILCVFGRYAYGKPLRGASYESTHFLPALQALGHEVSLFDSFDRCAFRDFAELNRALLSTVERLQPDLVLCVLMGYEVWRETLELIRRGTGAYLVNWGTDDSWKYEEFARFVSPSVDVYVTTYRDALKKAEGDGHRNFRLSQWAASSARLGVPRRAQDCIYPVSFVGAAYGNRRRWVEALRTRGIEVCCFGHGWEGGTIDEERVQRIYSTSVVSLNFADSPYVFRSGRLVRSRQVKARVFEITGAGGCLLTEPAEDLERLFVYGREVETFSTPDELARKVRMLLSDPVKRDALAMAGYIRTRREHTYEQRFRALLDAVSISSSERPCGRERGISGAEWAAFEGLVVTHRRLSLFLRVVRAVITAPCVALFGRARGKRAARRLLFEMSWRLVGGRTYSAAGLPGRLFYAES